MNLRQLRWPVVGFVLAITLAGLFGTRFLVRTQTVDQPLQQALAQIPELESYTVSTVRDRHEITVLVKGSADLKQTYLAVQEQVSAVLDSTQYVIKVEDRRTPELEQATARLDLHVQEGIQTGRFAAMADQLQAEAQRVNAQAQVAVDGERVYVSVRKGDDYLFSVVERPRPLTQKEGAQSL